MFRRLFFVLPFVVLAGCAQAPQNSAPPQGAPVVVSNAVAPAPGKQSGERQLPTDDLGRVVNLKAVPQRIVTIGPGATEMIFALGAGARLVGRDSGSDYPPGQRPRGVRGISVVGDFNGPFVESTVAARPDLIIVQGETYGRARIDDWQKKTGVPVAALSATSVDGVADGIKKVGAWIDAAAPAQNLASRLYLHRKEPRPGVTAFFEVGRKPLWTAGRDSLIDDILVRAGFTNAARDVAGYKQYNLESLLARQPNLYIVTSSRLKTALDIRSGLEAERARVLAALRREPALKGLKAIQAGRVLVVPGDWALRPGPRIYGAIQTLAEQAASLEKPTAAGAPKNRI
ncbi:MAG TPA: helical backbone metal receptor [Abditibacteriaceae bacterium]|jgi:iron complex transport system substrate-binding protein